MYRWHCCRREVRGRQLRQVAQLLRVVLQSSKIQPCRREYPDQPIGCQPCPPLFIRSGGRRVEHLQHIGLEFLSVVVIERVVPSAPERRDGRTDARRMVGMCPAREVRGGFEETRAIAE
jgi:hypothetical protein